MNILAFDIFADYAMFRKYYTTMSPLSFAIPGGTTIRGILDSLNFKGVVRVVRLVNEEHQNRLFASYIYSPELLIATQELLTKQALFEESDFYTLSKSYFHCLRTEKITKSRSLYILEQMEKLNYQNAFEYSKKTRMRFNSLKKNCLWFPLI